MPKKKIRIKKNLVYMVDFEKFTKLEGNRTNHAAIVVSKIIKNKIGRILLIRLLIKFEKLKF